jgi:hypothetical protein
MYLPRLVWLSFSTKYGINLRNLVDAAKKYENVDSCAKKEKILIYLCKNLLRSVKYREYKSNKKLLNSIEKNIYLNHKHELNSLLTVLSQEPSLASSVFNYPNPRKEARSLSSEFRKKHHHSHKSKRPSFKSSQSDNDLMQATSSSSYLRGEFYTKLEEMATHNDAGKYQNKRVNFGKISRENTTSKRKHPHHHHQTSDRSYSFNNLMQEASSTALASPLSLHRRSHKPTYYIIDPKLSTSLLMDYLNSHLSKSCRLTAPMSLLQSKITNVSRKHLLNMLTTGYEINEDEIEITSSNSGEQSGDHMAYLISSNVLQQLDDNLNHRNKSQTNEQDARTKMDARRSIFSCGCKFVPNLSNKYLSTLYILIKLGYVISSLSQMFFLNRLIGNNFYMIGFDLLKTFFYETEWPHMDVFPRMTL